MALSKLIFLTHLKLLTKPHRPPPSSFVSLRSLSFATPEEAAAERRRRKRRLRIEPPLNSLRSQSHPQQQPHHSSPPKNPNAPKLPEPVTALTGNRLVLHNKILTLIRQNDLDEAALLTRHSVYSNCRPTVFTCNAVMAALLRQSRYSDLLSLHRFVNQAGIAANVVTHNLLINAYVDCRKTDTALEHYKQLINDAPFNPSPTTYRILIKGLVDNSKLDRAIELKDEMLVKGLDADPIVYHYLMLGQARVGNGDGVFGLFEELKEKMGGVVSDGVVCGDLMKGYFLRGMEKEAMEVYNEACDEAAGQVLKYRMSAVAYNSVLDALSKNGKFDEAVNLFGRMMAKHDPPMKLSVNLGSFNVMVDGYCAGGRFQDAIRVFNSMGEMRCRPDTLSYNNLIEQLCNNGMLAEAEELYKGMGEKGVSPDEFTFVLLMDSCFRDGRPDDAAGYFKTMVDSKLRPNLGVYNRLIEGLVKVGKVDEAKSFYELMVGKLKMDDASYELMMKALFGIGKADEVLAMVGGLLRDEGLEFSAELQEFVKGELGKEGREEDLVKLLEDVEREKAEAAAKEAEAAEKAKASARAAVSSLLPSKLFGNKEEEKAEEEESVAETASETDSVDAVPVEEATVGENRSEATSEQVSAS
ncbi:pentatricopeptide repeat-containing protein At3g49240, mitochondrial [Rhododendron vialii]|uniref:pentatricopeptide repeat-containing protein At3g49240, mitochondrial n=1 Tax=Rhododendron vialii TaxID=182163 RepID=UPI00265F7A5A|nr:pentatricopeptide repeat-containing protein At3g49240, mitochondrial [Rhododendron vialii]